MSTAKRFVMMLVVGIILFVGLPLLGWGLDDIQGFVSNPARVAYIMLVIVLQVVISLLFPGVGRTGTSGTKTVQRQRLVVVLMQVLSLAIVIVAPFTDRRTIASFGASSLIRYLGLVLFVGGFVVMNWAEATLGKLFSVQVTVQSGHTLVTNGPYQQVRHPRYSGIILFNIGLSLVFGSGIALILVAALVLVLFWRIHDEEGLMHEEFGAEWEAYSRRSWKLIPFVF